MNNKNLPAGVLMIVGLIAVNFFYLSDLIITRTGEPGIVIGWKSAIAIGFSNLLALTGLWHVTRGAGRD
jgi:hypothetical protein